MKDKLTAGFLSVLSIFAPIQALILVTGVLIFSDLFTGIWAARKRGEWKTFSDLKSAGLRRTVTKIFVYESAITLGWLIEFYIIGGYIPISKLAAAAVSFVEMKSILENLDTINGSPVFRTLIEKLGSVNDIRKSVDQKEEKKDGESL